jgi:hypothetical protein
VRVIRKSVAADYADAAAFIDAQARTPHARVDTHTRATVIVACPAPDTRMSRALRVA